MREIKFRAWRGGDGGCMEFGHYVADHGNINWFDLSKSVGKDLILMQYTGLKDKSGKEIYDGDIFKDMDGSLAVVEWDNSMFLATRADGTKSGWPLFVFSKYLEVVGNIYENPELLKDTHEKEKT
jgi:uncharacterized phage protein (TIGR01671 family)